MALSTGRYYVLNPVGSMYSLSESPKASVTIDLAPVQLRFKLFKLRIGQLNICRIKVFDDTLLVL